MQARGLVKRYGDREALRGVSLSAASGELVAIIGPNGAGKTTLLSILAGILRPDEGELDLPAGEVGWVPQQAALYRRLTVEENLLLFARLEGDEDPHASVAEMLELTGLARAPRRDRRPPLRRQPAAGQHRDRAALAAAGAAARRAQRRPRPAPAGAAVGLRLRPRRGRHHGDLLHPRHPGGRALRRPLLVLADGESLFDGAAAALREAVRREAPEAAESDFETAFVAYLQHRGH